MHRYLLSILLASLSQCAYAQMVPPEQVGLSAKRLDDITRYLKRESDEGRIAGAVAAVSRHGRTAYLQAVGMNDLETQQPMESDALFRIASMTKAITSAAVMSLVEDGLISLDDPVSKFLPEFRQVKVFAAQTSGKASKPSAVQAPTIHHLLTHRSGLTYGWFGPESLDALYDQAGVNHLFEPTTQRIEDRVQQIARLPLKFEPGTAWDYGVSTDVLGRVIEVVSGMTLERFFHERFFRPLQMHDTFFYVPIEKQKRLAQLYTIDDAQKLKPVGEKPIRKSFFRFASNYCVEPGEFYSGGGGLVSSTEDYLRFLHMLLHGGELEGVRVLHRETVAAMTENQIGDLQIYLPGHGDGFGFGFGVVTDRGADADEFSVGSYSWGGIFSTYYWVDPQEALVGVLMTQVFPNDHLTIRDDFRALVYASVDDSGFERLYDYHPGDEYANPHFNGRQLRVNAPEVSTHPKFASRSEPRSSGMARILVEEDLRKIRRADLELSIWGGHPGTANKRVTLNGRETYPFAEVGTRDHNCTHQNPSFNLSPNDLVNGHNSLQFACDTNDTFWGHYIVDSATIRVGIPNDDSQLNETGLSRFTAEVVAQQFEEGEGYELTLDAPPAFRDRISKVQFEARYFGYDESGDGWANSWHRIVDSSQPDKTTSSKSQPHDERLSHPFSTRLLPAQQRVRFRAIVSFEGSPSLRYRTPVTQDYTIAERQSGQVEILTSQDLPQPFWSRAGKKLNCTIHLAVSPDQIRESELHVVAWTGGAGEVADYFTLNGVHFPIAEGNEHETVYSRINVDPKILRQGENKFELHSSTEHHGIEIMLPGPALVVRHRTAKEHPVAWFAPKAVKLSSAEYKTLDCYKIETSNATYYLDKIGAGLAGMVDRDGNDWLSFDPTKGTGASGEYRGFPNAVFQEAGSYFHARNAGTDACVTKVELETPEKVVISVESDNGKWAGRYTFTATECTFTMTKKPDGHNYWVLYEGTPGGQYEDSDWWMSAQDSNKHPMTERQDLDLTGNASTGEWIAFGDDKSPQVLVLRHHEDDSHLDRFYQMQHKMTVFGFGRAGMQKFLSTVPQSFSIAFQDRDEFVGSNQSEKELGVTQATLDASELAQYALTQAGDPKAGAKLFSDPRTKCSTCHQVGKLGGVVGPNLSNIGGKFDRPQLIDSLLYPSRQIGYGYETTIVLTEDGKTINGIAKESSDTHIKLRDVANKEISIPKAEIEATKISETSLMPSGLTASLQQQEFVDLIAYLETLGRAKAKFGGGVSGPVSLPDGFELTTIATGLSGAVAMDVAPDGSILVCEQGGVLRRVRSKPSSSSSATVLATDVETLCEIPVELNWERGLIGVTVAPNFPADAHVFVVYVTDRPYTHHRVSRFTIVDDKIDLASEVVLLKGDDQSKFGGNVPAGHQGGGIHFGPDGKLYVGLGEQTAGKPSQQMDALQGKILRLNPDGSVPADNPFLSETTGKYQAIWAKGCRNPFTLAFSRKGDMLINDVGGKFEEINRGLAGANYGWPDVDHGPTDRSGITGPIHIYPQSCINGGDFCESDAWPDEYRGKYFFADFNQGWVKIIDPQSPKKARDFLSGIRRPVDLRFGPDGSLYVLLRNAWVVDDNFPGGTGALVRISRASLRK